MSEQHIVFVHGRNFKPQQGFLEKSWYEAIRHGVARDFGEGVAAKLDNVKRSMAYFGDISNHYLRSIGKQYDEASDVKDRKQALLKLKEYKQEDFNKDRYDDLPGKTALKEALADAVSKPLEFFGLGDNIIGRVAPDMEDYWNPDESFGSDVRWRLTEILVESLQADDDILLVSHSLGTLISFDVLWKFCHYSEYRENKKLKDRMINRWVTLGSPLGNSTAKKKLKGARAKGARKYPHNIKRWINFAAEDDYISHDQTVADDYRKMIRLGLVESITDCRTVNLSVRKGKSNPHHGAGYLIEPEFSRTVVDWLSKNSVSLAQN